MKDNPIQFAVVREDPLIEAEVIRASGAERMLLVGSGGCTALTLQTLFPNLALTLVDPNPAQSVLIKRSRNVGQRLEIYPHQRHLGVTANLFQTSERHDREAKSPVNPAFLEFY